MNAIVPAQQGSALIPTDMRGAMDLAGMMSKGRLVPQHFWDKPGDALMVIEQAMRWGMSPFAVAQETSVIQGKLMFSGKLVSAAIHASGIMAGRLSYEFGGEGDGRWVVASGTLRGEDKPREMKVFLKDVKTSNGMWQKQTDQQLVYSSTRAWARRHTPEVMLGVYSPEEMEPASAPFQGPTLEARPEPPQSTPNDPMGEPAPRARTRSQWMADLQADLNACQTREDVDAHMKRDDVRRAMSEFTNGSLERLEAMLDAAMHKTAPAVHEEAEP